MSRRARRLVQVSCLAAVAVALNAGATHAAGTRSDPMNPSQHAGNVFMHRLSSNALEVLSPADRDAGTTVCRVSAGQTDRGGAESDFGELIAYASRVGTFEVSYRTCPSDIAQPENGVRTLTVTVAPTKMVDGRRLAPKRAGGRYRLRFDNPNTDLDFTTSVDTVTLHGRALCIWGSFKSQEYDGKRFVPANRARIVAVGERTHRDWVCLLDEDFAFAGASKSFDGIGIVFGSESSRRPLTAERAWALARRSS